MFTTIEMIVPILLVIGDFKASVNLYHGFELARSSWVIRLRM